MVSIVLTLEIFTLFASGFITIASMYCGNILTSIFFFAISVLLLLNLVLDICRVKRDRDINKALKFIEEQREKLNL